MVMARVRLGGQRAAFIEPRHACLLGPKSQPRTSSSRSYTVPTSTAGLNDG